MNHLKLIILFVSIILTTNIIATVDNYPWQFPKDHGAHKAFNTEWWYFTGHLTEETTASTYGFELTFFRVQPTASVTIKNPWSPTTLYFAHFALTHDETQTFQFFERINRDSFGMANASEHTLAVHNGDWKATLTNNQLTLHAITDTIELTITIPTTNPIILNGQEGYSIKNHEASQFSYYYSMPRLLGSGYLIENNITKNISAAVWFDHEFFNSTFSNQQQAPQQQSIGKNYNGWDWFALQLDDGSTLMIAQVRSSINVSNNYYFGTWVSASGNQFSLTTNDIKLIALNQWKSKTTATTYPAEWNIVVPKYDIDVNVKPTVKNQELILTHLNGLNYWEGRSIVTGTHTGNAYVELVGYD